MPRQILVSNLSEHAAYKRSCRILDAWLSRLSPRAWYGPLSDEGIRGLCAELAALRSRDLHLEILRLVAGEYEPVRFIGASTPFADGRASLGLARRQTEKPGMPAALEFLQCAIGLAANLHDIGKLGYRPGTRESFQSDLFGRGTNTPRLCARHEILSAEFFKRRIPVPFAEAVPLPAIPAHSLLPDNPADNLIFRLIATHHHLPDFMQPDSRRLQFSKSQGGERPIRRNTPLLPDGSYAAEADFALQALPGSGAIESRRQRLLSAIDAIPPEQVGGWLRDAPEYLFSLGRLALLLGDHAASQAEEVALLGANPAEADREKWKLKAKALQATVPLAKSIPVPLVDHLGHVYHASRKAFWVLTQSFPCIGELPAALRPAPDGRFAWQAMASQAIQAQRLGAADGFFAVVLAGVGAGKTQGGFRIASALRQDKARFTVALGQGGLAVQQGVEYREKIGLTAEECAIFVGWRSRDLLKTQLAALTEASQRPDDLLEVDGGLSEVARDSVLAHLPRDARAFINTPVSVMTIDHLMSALTGDRGALVPATVRVATTDLVIDEIDSFTTTDFHAIGRLIHLAGLHGRRVIIKSATVTPEIATGLFNAYAVGYRQYQAIHGGRLFAGWFGDQLGGVARVAEIKDVPDFRARHLDLTREIRASLLLEKHRRKLALLEITADTWAWDILQRAAQAAERAHSATGRGGQLSTAFVRFNVTRTAFDFVARLPALIERLTQDPAFADLDIRFNILTSRMDVASRRSLERNIGLLTQRKDSGWQDLPEIRALTKRTLFLLVTTPILEVGRDFDFDFCVLEPASDASIIQASGRVLRHRPQLCPDEANVFLLSKSIRELTAKVSMLKRKGTVTKGLPYGEMGAGVEKLGHHKNGRPKFWAGDQKLEKQPVADNFGVPFYAQGIHAGHRISDALIPADQLDRQLQQYVLDHNLDDDYGATGLADYLALNPVLRREREGLGFRSGAEAQQVILVWWNGAWHTQIHERQDEKHEVRLIPVAGHQDYFGTAAEERAMLKYVFFPLAMPKNGTRASWRVETDNELEGVQIKGFRYHPTIGLAPLLEVQE